MFAIPKCLNNIHQKYKDILSSCVPYILTFPDNLKKYNLNPWGLNIEKENQLSCINSKNAMFFDLLQVLDQKSFGQVGMPMEKWVFFDCGEMVGGIVGLAKKAEDLPSNVLEVYGLDKSYKGLVPFSMFIAIPMASGSWFGHNLCSANAFLGENFPLSGLALLTKSLGVTVLNIKEMFGATQWESPSIHIHSQLADMEIHSAYTPAHSFEKTMTYKSTYLEEDLISALSGKDRIASNPHSLIDVTDNYFYKDIQKKIEAGLKYKIIGRPISQDGKSFLPINHST